VPLPVDLDEADFIAVFSLDSSRTIDVLRRYFDEHEIRIESSGGKV
jgi:hypothetical protein